MSWTLLYTEQAQKDAPKLAAAGLESKATLLLAVLRENPYQNLPPFETLAGNLAGADSRHISIQHRLVYQVLKEQRVVKGLRLWTH